MPDEGIKMKLEKIGFYSLSDKRAKNVSWRSDLWRCELLLTHKCNFNCVYCRGIKPELQQELKLYQAKEIISKWKNNNLHNIRFSGGEPTLWQHGGLLDLVKFTRKTNPNMEHIAISTNGSASLEYYFTLHDAGVNDFSISLDGCCSSTANKMSGVNCQFAHISNVIYQLSKITYLSVGIVLNENNIEELEKTIKYATSLGASDIRIISAAQSNCKINLGIKTNYPILNYRLRNLKRGVRGLQESDCHKCHLVKDDMAIVAGKHFPCIIFLREGGKEIGNVYGKSIEEIREERKAWFDTTNTYENEICRKNCLDVCVEYNNRVRELSENKTEVTK